MTTTSRSPYARSLRVLAHINLRQAKAARASGNATFRDYHLKAARDFRATANRIPRQSLTD